jgi:hypothetical protein
MQFRRFGRRMPVAMFGIRAGKFHNKTGSGPGLIYFEVVAGYSD